MKTECAVYSSCARVVGGEPCILGEVVNRAADSVMITDADGIIEYANSAWEVMSGWKAVEAIGHKPNILKSGKHDDIFYRNLWTTILGGDSWRGVVINKRRDGDLYLEEKTIAPLFENDKIVRFVGIGRDVSEREEQLNRLKVDTLSHQQGVYRLLAALEHELRSPLGAVEVLADNLAEGIYTGEVAKEKAGNIFRHAVHARSIMNRLLVLGKGLEEPDTEETQYVNFGEFMQELAEVPLVCNELKSRIEFTVEAESFEDMWVVMPRQALTCVFNNLLVNAAEAMTLHESIGVVKVLLEEVSGDHVDVAVVDDGPGITEEVEKRLFRGGTTKRARSGKNGGYGLKLVKGLTEKWGGWVKYVKSDSGAKFVVRLKIFFVRALLRGVGDAIEMIEGLSGKSRHQLGLVFLSVAEKITESGFGFVGLMCGARFNTIAVSDNGWESCKIPETDAVMMINNMIVRGLWSIPIKTGESVIVNAPQGHLESVEVPKGHPEITALLSVPLISDGKVIGVLALANREGGYEDGHLDILEKMAEAFVAKLTEDESWYK